MGDTAAFAPEAVKLFEFKWLKPGSNVVILLILLEHCSGSVRGQFRKQICYPVSYQFVQLS